MAEGAGDDPAPRRASRPATPSRGSISRSSASASWDDCPAVPPEIVLLPDYVRLQHLQDVLLVARHRRAAVDHLGVQALLPGARDTPRSPSCTSARRKAHVRPRARRGALLARLLHAYRPRPSSAWTPPSVRPCARRRWRPARRGSTSGSAHVRRPGRDLPADHQHDHRLPLPGLRDGRSPPDRPRSGSSRSSSSRTRRRCTCSPASPRSGTRPS